MHFNNNNDFTYLFRSKCIKTTRKKGFTLIELMVYLCILVIIMSSFMSIGTMYKRYEEKKEMEWYVEQIHSLITYSELFCKANDKSARIVNTRGTISLETEERKIKTLIIPPKYNVYINTDIDNILVISSKGNIYTSGTISIKGPRDKQANITIQPDNSYVRVR
ncbi:hypothetical protein CPJCM30710_06300 [Clostridium polyendosporum]|uniref:Prepilin-type N-terminal cleavage/methylation domain-containing protein n=1 Tax=Clostridium polyendosporum TaxID=69208 RepID=A0A919RY95_9CLOT|nr:prepilin-type N-terminal cleavage/methylation domain-containing protein [Clostridium polyendosporum]GIM27964.1 hypothetical protein CPJCM30710_06300 [Clostridium polyendosporum]